MHRLADPIAKRLEQRGLTSDAIAGELARLERSMLALSGRLTAVEYRRDEQDETKQRASMRLEARVAVAEARAGRLKTALAKADAALVQAMPPALRLANDAEGIGWGEVSDLGCDVVHGLESARSALADGREE